MSTRCNIVLLDEKLPQTSQVWTQSEMRPHILYRHSDGYPEGVKPHLDRYCKAVRNNNIRDWACQGATWLFWMGMLDDLMFNPDYGMKTKTGERKVAKIDDPGLIESVNANGTPYIGDYNLTQLFQFDLEFVHVVDTSVADRAHWWSFEAEHVLQPEETPWSNLWRVCSDPETYKLPPVKDE